MPRYRLDIEYDGSAYAGWQRQAGQPSVQGAIEQAVLAFSGEAVGVRGAGRTDAGVHATGQVAHLDLEKSWPANTIINALNAHLAMAGERIAILATTVVEDAFDARFTAIGRHYLYRIVNRRAPLALDTLRAWRVIRKLDADAMHEAAQNLVGRHDFSTFRSAHCQAKSPLRTLERLDVRRTDDLIEIGASARSFLHNQVRSMVGSLKQVGEGRWSAADLEAALKAKDRRTCGEVAPPEGLYLTRVDYPGG